MVKAHVEISENTELLEKKKEMEEIVRSDLKTRVLVRESFYHFGEKMRNARPFVKWAGGKGQLIEQIKGYIPQEFKTYYEPFVGGGALFFYLWNEERLKKAVIADNNSDLINIYQVIKEKPQELIDELKKSKYKNEKEAYYKIREWEPRKHVLRAARMLYLNKTCFNGLYRVNSKGKFNVPFGKYKNPRFLNEDNIWEVHNALKKTKICLCDFAEAVRDAKRGDFVYFDPPYYPLSATANFTSYTKNSFNDDDQKRLAETFRHLAKEGVYVMLSNSYTNFIEKLYKDFNLKIVYARRAINSDADGRGKIMEYLILNY